MEDKKINNDVEVSDNDLLEQICEELCRNPESVDVKEKGDGYLILTEKRIGKTYKLTDKYPNGFLKDNEKIKVFKDRGFKFGNYLEVLFDYYAMTVKDSDMFEMQEFCIDNVTVKIENPSFLFDLVFDGFDKYYDNHIFHTISLNGITEKNYEEYLTKALFLIGYYNPDIDTGDFPSCCEYPGEYYSKFAPDEDDIIRRREKNHAFTDMKFNNIKYLEALAFYNEGKRLHGYEIAFQYFYKVIEHFFLVCRQEDFKKLISDYNNDNNIDCFIEKVTSIYKQNEDVQLKELLLSIKTDITDIIDDCFSGGYIADKTVESFGQEFYLYRNTIVHGKSDDKFIIKTPSNVGSPKESFWSGVAERIAEILIKKYCL